MYYLERDFRVYLAVLEGLILFNCGSAADVFYWLLCRIRSSFFNLRHGSHVVIATCGWPVAAICDDGVF